VDLTVAIGVGMVLAAFLFIRRMASVTSVSNMLLEDEDATDNAIDDGGADRLLEDGDGLRRRDIPRGVEVYEITGPFFFGAAATFRDTISQISGTPRVLVIRMRDVMALDSTGMHALREVARAARRDGTTVLLADVHMQPQVALTGTPTLAEIGAENVFGSLDEALTRARALVGV
jgi:SulP family sulfate permease